MATPEEIDAKNHSLETGPEKPSLDEVDSPHFVRRGPSLTKSDDPWPKPKSLTDPMNPDKDLDSMLHF